jgi:NTE family protein
MLATSLLAIWLLAPGATAEPEGAAPEPATAVDTVEPAPASPADRPRIGLVLSGGGARGAAHIGVLRVLEEMRIPVDLVTGTSMGAVVGGLYAAGLSPNELDDAIQGIDWVKVFEDDPGRQDLSFRRKQDDRSFLTNLRLGFKDWSLFIPTGLVEGQKLDFLLRSLTLTEQGVARIEDLPLPFRAVATDIATGEAVVFDRGLLAVAQRASMSIPAAFSPVKIDGRLLVDGFVANNLPIDVAQELGADHVIAVDISTPVSELADLTDAVVISGQVSTFPTQQQQARQIERLGPEDVLLQPPLGNLSSASFTQMATAIEIGERAARAAAPQLARYSVSEEEYQAWRARQRRPPVQMPLVDAIRIENRSMISDTSIRARIETQAGERLDPTLLSKDLGRLFGLDAFERVQFDLAREAEGMVLTYHLDPRERGEHHFRLGLNLETVVGDEAAFNLGVNHVWYPINAWGAELRTGASFGDTSGVATGFYQPVDPREWFFVLPLFQYSYQDLDIWRGDERIARYDVEQTTSSFLVGANLSNVAQLRGGIGYTDGEARRKIGDPSVFRRTKLHGGFYNAALEYDTLDNTEFPNDGAYGRFEGLFFREELGFDDSFERLETETAIFRTWRRNTFGLRLRYDTAFNTPKRVGAVSTLGGFLNLSGFPTDSLVEEHVGLAQLLTYRRIASPAVFAWEFPVYLGAAFEAGNAWRERRDIDNDVLLSVAPFFGVETPLGPLYIAYAYGEGGEHQGYLFLGTAF